MAKSRIVEVEYNIADRGRIETGIPRPRFDVPSAIAVINNSQTQEKVRCGDLFGYLGHAYRTAFGLDPQESVVTRLGMKVYDPAFLTLAIEANAANGMVYHKTEFCDTEEGDKVMRLNDRKHGGFSSVFRNKPFGNKDIAQEFYGFDYVYLVNYAGNRNKMPQSQAQMDSAAGTATNDIIVFGEGESVVYFDSCGSVAMYDSARQMAALLSEHQEREAAIIQSFSESEMQLEASRNQVGELQAQLDSAAKLFKEQNEFIEELKRAARYGRSCAQLDSAANIDVLASRRQYQKPAEKPKDSGKTQRPQLILPTSFTG